MKIFKIILVVVIVILLVFRLCLPSIILHYVENQINKIPEYRAKIADVNVQLIRGSYTLVHMQLWKITKNIPVPYFAADTIDFSVQWSALLHGKFVAKIIVNKPVINLVSDPNGNNEQITINKRWLDIVKTLFPLNINRLEARDGEIFFRSYKGNPPFTTYVNEIEFVLENMQNSARIQQLLPSSFSFTGKPIGGGKIEVAGKFNPFDKTPTFELKGKLNSLKVINIAGLLKHYTSLDVVGGTFSLYGDVVAANNIIKGEAKPFFKNLKIGDPSKESPLGVIYNGLASVAAKVLENGDKKTVATKIKISGRIDDPDTSIFSIIGYLIRHAFIQALLPQVDTNVKMQDVMYGKSISSKQFPSYHN